MCDAIEFEGREDDVNTCGELVAEIGAASIDELIQLGEPYKIEEHHCLCGIDIEETLAKFGYAASDIFMGFVWSAEKFKATPESN